MFFFIGGIQPRTVTLDDSRRLCPSCGLNQVRNKRIDHYISFFFIPIFRIKKGEPFMECERCGAISYDINTFSMDKTSIERDIVCQNCGKKLKKRFLYCPFCGIPKSN